MLIMFLTTIGTCQNWEKCATDKAKLFDMHTDIYDLFFLFPDGLSGFEIEINNTAVFSDSGTYSYSPRKTSFSSFHKSQSVHIRRNNKLTICEVIVFAG